LAGSGGAVSLTPFFRQVVLAPFGVSAAKDEELLDWHACVAQQKGR
jgi:hypothetical protein